MKLYEWRDCELVVVAASSELPTSSFLKLERIS
jgi:hypothetical protein